MILQTKATTLAALLATDGGQCPHLQAVRDALILARAETEIPALPDDISNDRTTLNHQK